MAVGELHDDPDRLREPLIRRCGDLEPESWDEAFEAADEALGRVLERSGKQALGIYFGNPTTPDPPARLLKPL